MAKAGTAAKRTPAGVGGRKGGTRWEGHLAGAAAKENRVGGDAGIAVSIRGRDEEATKVSGRDGRGEALFL